MLNVKKLTRKYKNGDSYINAVDDITAGFSVGEFVFVLGASGSGKSTLLNILCGLDTDIEGSVEVDGVDTSGFSKKDWAIYRNHYVGFVFQEYNLIEHLKVWENVALPLQFQGVSKSEAKKRAIEELEHVGLGKFVNKYPNRISGGQAQRVAIARALVTNPKVIMADEPTGALDTELGDQVIGYLKKVSKDRVVVVVTHDEDLAQKYASRIIKLSDGKIESDSENKMPVEKQAKEIDFDRPKMKLGMMFKFAKNNITSRMFRSLATSSIVSIGYISIFLLTFLIFGINSSISDTISKFLPEDQYALYNANNAEISTDQINEIASLPEIENVRYDVFQAASFSNITGSNREVYLVPVPYDMAYLTKDGELFGRAPQNDNEILIDVGTAAAIRNVSNPGEDSYQYIYDLIKGYEMTLEVIQYDSFGSTNNIDLGEYTVVGMIASTDSAVSMSSLIYMDYEKLLQISSDVNKDDIYKSVAIAYLSTSNQKEIDELRVTLRDDYDIVMENFFESITSSVEEVMFKGLKIFVGIASISLVVSGILIGLVIYTSILERIKEIGILTAVGAKQSNIIGIFLMESAMIGLLASLIATGVGLLLTRMINGLFSNFIEKPLNLLSAGMFEMTLLTPKLWIIFAVIGFSVLYSMLAGLIPSFRASKMNAVKALRRE